jgi:DNA-binding GntR family transcriptional regulator
LREIEIADQMGISRGPIREALRLLESDGLIEHRSRQGAFVRDLQLREVSEIYSSRRLIEGHIAALAAQRATAEDIERLYEAMERAREKAADENYQATVVADFGLHRIIWEIAGNKTLAAILNGLVQQLHAFMAAQAPLFSHLYESVKDHSAIIKAIENADPEVARQTVQSHIHDAERLAINRLTEHYHQTDGD